MGLLERAPARRHAAEDLALHGAVPGGVADGRGRFTIDQGVEMGRPSELEATVLVEGELPVGVRVEGSAVLVMRGELDV